jgi:hypothetical protein
MLQRVALGQIRFNLPGLGVDGRGVVAGKQCAARFGAIDRLVSFFRILSSARSLDDLQPGLRIIHARAVGGTREAIVLIPSGSTHLMDAVARAARTAGGQCFTGNGRHFVQYRDARAPLGYDAVAVSQEPGELTFYGAESVIAYHIDSELPLGSLLLRLSLQRQHGAPAEASGAGPFYLTARRGLGTLVAEYLYRAQFLRGAPPEGGKVGAPPLRASAAFCEGPADGTFASSGAFWLFRLEGVPPRMMGLLTRTPGLALYAPVIDNVVVAVGYRHPIHLDSCKASFPADHFYLFSPEVSGVTVLTPPPVLAGVDDLVRIRGPHPQDPDITNLLPAPRREVTVPLRLELASETDRHAVATLIPWRQADWLRRLCYALPGPALRGHRVALLDRGILVIAGGVLEGFPFGVLLDSAAPDVLVPLGARLRPAVSPSVLADRAGAGGGAIVVFPGLGEAPFRVPADAVEPLERRTLSHPDLLEVERDLVPRRRIVEPVEPMAIEIENDRLGPMPLWGLELSDP